MRTNERERDRERESAFEKSPTKLALFFCRRRALAFPESTTRVVRERERERERERRFFPFSSSFYPRPLAEFPSGAIIHAEVLHAHGSVMAPPTPSSKKGQRQEENAAAGRSTNNASPAPPYLAQLLSAAGVPVNPLDGSTSQQQMLQFQQQQNAAANFAAATALTLSGVNSQLKSFGNNSLGLGGPANSGGQPGSPSFWKQFYAQQALVGSLYNQQQQFQGTLQGMSNGANLNNEKLSFLSNFSTGMGGGTQPTTSYGTRSSGGNAIFDNEDLKELLNSKLQQKFGGSGIGEINSSDAARKRKLSQVNTKNININNKRKQLDSGANQQPGSRGNSAFSPFANSGGDGNNNIFTTSELMKVKSLQEKKKRSAEKKNKKSNSDKATSQERKPGEKKTKKQKETNPKTMQLADAAMSLDKERSNVMNDQNVLKEVMKLQQGYIKETPEEREKREKDEAAMKMKQLSTRGHTTRATEKEELYKSIVDVDGNLLKPEVLERFEANANKMTQLNKEHEEQKKLSESGGKKNGAVSALAQAAAQKITGASDDVMAKVRGILEEELSDAETDIAEGDETGVLDNNKAGKPKENAKKLCDAAQKEEKSSDLDKDGKDIKVRSRSWSQEEDDLVQVLVSQVGPKKWALIASQLSGKTQKQAYARWRDYLQPGLTSRPWTRWEEIHLLDCQAHIGNQWAILARFMPGRSPNAIKNRFHATKRKKERKSGAVENEKNDISEGNPTSLLRESEGKGDKSSRKQPSEQPEKKRDEKSKAINPKTAQTKAAAQAPSSSPSGSKKKGKMEVTPPLSQRKLRATRSI